MASLSRGLKGNVDEFCRGFPVFKALSDDPQRKSLHPGDGLVPIVAVGHDTGESRNVGQPPAIILLLDFNLEIHVGNVSSGLGERLNEIVRSYPPAPSVSATLASGLSRVHRLLPLNSHSLRVYDGGGGGIRTRDALAGITVFKTVAFNRSATPPWPASN